MLLSYSDVLLSYSGVSSVLFLVLYSGAMEGTAFLNLHHIW